MQRNVQQQEQNEAAICGETVACRGTNLPPVAAGRLRERHHRPCMPQKRYEERVMNQRKA